MINCIFEAAEQKMTANTQNASIASERSSTNPIIREVIIVVLFAYPISIM